MSEKIVNIDDVATLRDDTELTDDQVGLIYNSLKNEDKASQDNLKNAIDKTESTQYTSEDNNVIEAQDMIPGVDAIPSNLKYEETTGEIEETEENIKDTLEMYGIKDEDVELMLDVINQYKNDKNVSITNIYNKLPASFKTMVDNLAMLEGAPKDFKQLRAMRNAATRTLLDEFINDSKLSKAVEDYTKEVSDAINEMETGYNKIINDAINDAFDKIDKIEAENPTQAANIKAIKQAFKDAVELELQLNIASHTSSKKIAKWATRFSGEVIYFNKKVSNNIAGVKIPDISELVPIIKSALPQYTHDEIKQFLCVVVRSIDKIDINTLYGISYIYSMISNIYKYKFCAINDEKGEKIFGNISRVIDAILS